MVWKSWFIFFWKTWRMMLYLFNAPLTYLFPKCRTDFFTQSSYSISNFPTVTRWTQSSQSSFLTDDRVGEVCCSGNHRLKHLVCRPIWISLLVSWIVRLIKVRHTRWKNDGKILFSSCFYCKLDLGLILLDMIKVSWALTLFKQHLQLVKYIE